MYTQNEEIAMQRDYTQELSERFSEKNNQLTESIYYAKNIQGSVFRQRKVLKAYGCDCFIIFKPRDIISGDFKWSGRAGKHVVLAAADCTGHGIPGALLSIMGVTLLNDIVIREKCVQADKIFNKLRKRMVQAMSQGVPHKTRGDGMDISLCVFDFSEKILDYAEANGPLLRVRNAYMTEFKPDRMPVSTYEKDYLPFTKNSVSEMRQVLFVF